jgi:hypothetical protein
MWRALCGSLFVFVFQLVLGISSEVLEDNFNVNWLEQKVSGKTKKYSALQHALVLQR